MLTEGSAVSNHTCAIDETGVAAGGVLVGEYTGEGVGPFLLEILPRCKDAGGEWGMTDLDRFWTLVGDARAGAKEEDHCLERIRASLQRLSPDELLAFQRTFYRLSCESYSRKLWGAAYLLNGGCSDDGFEYFRSWLIAQGREVLSSRRSKPGFVG